MKRERYVEGKPRFIVCCDAGPKGAAYAVARLEGKVHSGRLIDLPNNKFPTRRAAEEYARKLSKENAA